MRTRVGFTLLVLVAVLAFAQAANAMVVGVGHSGWNWGNPQPQGNTLHAVEFAGGVGYAAGDFGTLLRTQDGGNTWQGIATGITGNLLRIRAVDQNTVVIGSGCVLRRSDDGGQTFHRLPFVSSETACPSGLNSFHFPTTQVGYIALDDGSVIETADGGSSFAGRTAVPGTAATNPGSTVHPTDVFFTSPTTGFATTTGGVLYRTTDSGGSWTQKFTGGHPLNGLLFTDAATGYAVGDGNTLLKTTDSGNTWTPMPISGVPNDDLTQIRCANASTCLISTRSGDRVLRTTDGGATVQAVKPSTEKIFAISFASATAAVGVGDSGATVASPDAGSSTATPSFTRIGSRLGGGQVKLGRLRATSSSLVYATADNGRFARSTDGGMSWALGSVPTSEDLRDISFADQNTGYALDVAGALRTTANGGSTWTPLDTGGIPNPSALATLDTSTVLLVGPRGLRRATDGKTFQAVPGKVGSASLTDYDTGSGAVFVWGGKSVFVSTNKGASWKAVKGPVKKPSYNKVDFVSGKVGYALTTDGRVWKTNSGGRKWTELFGAGTVGAFDISFGDANDGFLTIGSWPSGAARAGYVLRTSDGGASWRPELIEKSVLAQRGLVATGTGTAFALDSAQDLFGTAGGGDQGTPTAVTLRASRTRLAKPGNVKISGRLSPGVTEAPITLFVRSARSASWRTVRVAPVSGSGTFTAALGKVRRTSYVVAQWPGDADHNGDGSPPLKITVKRK